MSLRDAILDAPLLRQPAWAVAVDVVVFTGFVVVAAAIIMDFRRYHRQSRSVARSGRSLVETGSMTAFFLVYYVVIRARLAEVAFGGAARAAAIAIGVALVVIGVAFNVYGRTVLRSSWANQITIYEGQRLSTTGPYSIVRHPLYASLIWIFIGGSMIYANPLALVLTLGVFLPMMRYRAKQEESLLLEAFQQEYKEYSGRTGMFVPRIGGRRWTT